MVFAAGLQLRETMDQQKLIELNMRFLEEVERGATWEEVREILDEIRVVVRGSDTATILQFDSLPLNKTGDTTS
jgi:hypothetical protein